MASGPTIELVPGAGAYRGAEDDYGLLEWIEQNVPLATLVQLAEEVGGDPVLDFSSRAVKVANAKPRELAKALRAHFLARWKLHVLLIKFGWVPPEWAPYTGSETDVPAMIEHMIQHLAWGEIWAVLFKRFGHSTSAPAAMKRGFTEKAITEYCRVGSGNIHLARLLAGDTHPLADVQW